MIFRPAVQADSVQIMHIIRDARERMRLRGSLQWQGSYPAEADIARDISHGYGYVLCLGDCVVAYGAVIFDGEAAYDAIEGAWPDQDPYVAVHRLAVAEGMTGRGAGSEFMQRTAGLARSRGVRSFRVDTNFDNAPMQKIVAAQGFRYCGKVHYDGSPRMAYHKNI